MLEAAALALLLADTAFHHLMLNGVDAGWFQGRLPVDGRIQFAPRAKVRPTPKDQVNAFWHFGFGAADFDGTVRRLKSASTKFAQEPEPLTETIQYAYLAMPNGALIELFSRPTEGLIHLHLYAEDPIVAGKWFVEHLGLKPRRPLEYKPVKIGKYESWAEAVFDAGPGINLLISPAPTKRPLVAPMTDGPVGYLAFAVDDLDATLSRLPAAAIVMKARATKHGRAARVISPGGAVLELISR